MLSVVLYTTPSCVQCNATKRKLTDLGVAFRTVDLSLPEHADAHTYVTDVLGFKAAPVVVVYDDSDEVDRSWSGFQPAELEALAVDLRRAA